MITLRRYLCLCALLFWQGGFTFYAAAVIPIAGVVLDPNLHQRARITDAATNVLNIAGIVAVLLLLWEVASSPDPSRRRFWFRGTLWLILFVTLAALFPLHYWLEILDSPGGTGPADMATFYRAHQIYLWVSAVQWLGALIYLGVTVQAWRSEDARAAAPGELQKMSNGNFRSDTSSSESTTGSVGVQKMSNGNYRSDKPSAQ